MWKALDRLTERELRHALLITTGAQRKRVRAELERRGSFAASNPDRRRT